MIKLNEVQLLDVHLTPGANKVKSVLVFSGTLTTGIVKELGASIVIDKGGIIKSGFDSLKFSAGYRDATVKHFHKVSNLEMNGCIVDNFLAHRIGGKKKPKKMLVSFRVTYGGPPFQLVEHMLKLGKGEGEMTVDAPEQQDLPLTADKQPAPKAKAKTMPIRRVKK